MNWDYSVLCLSSIPGKSKEWLRTVNNNCHFGRFMENSVNNKGSVNRIAKDYFYCLGSHLPQQCASDEFYFLPRSEAAIQHLDTLDDLSPEKVQHCLLYVKNPLREMSENAVRQFWREEFWGFGAGNVRGNSWGWSGPLRLSKNPFSELPTLVQDRFEKFWTARQQKIFPQQA